MKGDLLLVFCFVYSVSCQLLVTLPTGQIQGQQKYTFINRSYHSFEGVPFAKPPLGALRFQAPQPPENWEGVLNTTKLNTCCYSVTYDFDSENEDCLYLNLHTPILDRDANKTKLPVLFWIYGGGFSNGCANSPPQYYIDEDIVLVFANYRLGPFGFLATGDAAAPGNAGLKDQALALKWTHDNIHLFGGDNQKITVAGQSAGGASTGWHLLSPLSRGLFRAAIMQSGTPLDTWAYRGNVLEFVTTLADKLNSTLINATTYELVEFLKQVDAKDIDNASHSLTTFALPVLEPDHEGAFATQAMYEAYYSGNYTKVPTIIGTTSEEKIAIAADNNTLQEDATLADDHIAELFLPPNFNYKPNVSKTEMAQNIREIYVGNSSFRAHVGKVVKLYSDKQYSRGIIAQGKLMAKHNDVFFYIFSYKGQIGGLDLHIPECDNVGHAEELNYSMGKLSLDLLDKADILTHYRMMRMWTNFIKYLNPIPKQDELLENVIWEKVTEGKFNYLNINATLTMEVDPRGDLFKGWEAIFDEYAQRPYVTY